MVKKRIGDGDRFLHLRDDVELLSLNGIFKLIYHNKH